MSRARRAMCLPIGAVMIAVSALAPPAAAKPPGFQFTNTTARVDLAIPGATVCVLRPVAQRVAAGCAGIDADLAAKALTPSTAAAALVREGAGDEQRIWILAITPLGRVRSGPMTIEDAEDFATGTLEGAAESGKEAMTVTGLGPDATHTRLLLAGGQVIRQRLDRPASADGSVPAVRAATAALVGREDITSLLVMPITPQDTDVEDALTRVLARTRITPPPGPVEWQTRDHWKGRRVGEQIGGVLGVALAPAMSMFVGLHW